MEQCRGHLAAAQPRAAVGGGMAWRGPVESMGRFDVEFDVVLQALHAEPACGWSRCTGTPFYSTWAKGAAWLGSITGAWQRRCRRPGRRKARRGNGGAQGAPPTTTTLRGGRRRGSRGSSRAWAMVQVSSRRLARRRWRPRRRRRRSSAAAKAAARRVRWAPVSPPCARSKCTAEVQLKQQAWQAIKAGKPAAEAAADAEDAMELEAQAEAEAAEARRAVRAESGKRQAVAGAPAEAAQAQAGMAGVEARSWAAVAAGGSGAARAPAGKRAQRGAHGRVAKRADEPPNAPGRRRQRAGFAVGSMGDGVRAQAVSALLLRCVGGSERSLSGLGLTREKLVTNPRQRRKREIARHKVWDKTREVIDVVTYGRTIRLYTCKVIVLLPCQQPPAGARPADGRAQHRSSRQQRSPLSGIK